MNSVLRTPDEYDGVAGAGSAADNPTQPVERASKGSSGPNKFLFRGDEHPAGCAKGSPCLKETSFKTARSPSVEHSRFDSPNFVLFESHARRATLADRERRPESTHFLGAVVIGKSSVRNGEAGKPSLFQRLTTGKSAQPKRTATGLETAGRLT